MNKDKLFLEIALEEAEHALVENTYPVGAILVDENNQIVAKGRNQVHSHHDATAHAEINAIQLAGKTVLDAKVHGKKLTLYSSLEPCLMCTGAILFANIKKVVWILNDDSGFGSFNKVKEAQLFEKKYNEIEIMEEPYDDLKIKQIELMKQWSMNSNHVDNLRK
ncbi:nucleoside deaminase [Ornithinibacillus halotolerans]|uniref:tRNA-specific adenosine deaminase n=1 Tax=Ornithinibacillus halotolerans TaxID=1274357 RepID=A0A916RUY1_9BACI|nr:nucleoside deaminase [Ornithinibacillus halotolerans]GGA72286.1 tRNA-specific adenosine deaminase [Ornithinibacillus halotolerans]